MNLENLKRKKIKMLLQFVLYQSYYATKLIIRTTQFLYQIMMLKLKNTFGYTKAQFDNDENLKQSFNKLTCYNYFKNVFKATSPRRVFTIPSWLTKFNQPTHAFDDTPPT